MYNNNRTLKNKRKTYFIAIMIFFLVLVAIIMSCDLYNKEKRMNYYNQNNIYKNNIYKNNNKVIKWYQCKDDNSYSFIKNILAKYNIYGTHNIDDDWNIALPCHHQFSNKFLRNINNHIKYDDQILSHIHNNYVLGTKEYLWKKLYEKLGRTNANIIMPNTFIFPDDAVLFNKMYSPFRTYIMKKEEQRQKGLKITRNLNEINNSSQNNYVVVQEFLNNPMTYNSRKINIRIYLLIMSYYDRKNNMNVKRAYYFDDGIMSYTKKKWEKDSLDPGRNIASFYDSKPLYKNGYPITLKIFLNRMLPLQKFQILKNIRKKLHMLLSALGTEICNMNFKNGNMSHQLFGVDFYVDRNLQSRILEINAGPGMDPFINIDHDMRTKLNEDIFKMLGIIPHHGIFDNGFTEFWNNVDGLSYSP